VSNFQIQGGLGPSFRRLWSWCASRLLENEIYLVRKTETMYHASFTRSIW